MEILGFHVPGTRDKDKEIEQLREVVSDLNATLLHKRDQEGRELYRQLQEAKRDLNLERANHKDLEEKYVDAMAEHEGVKAELERLQELAPYQVRHWDLTVRKACMTLEEAIEEASRPGPAGNVYITKREGNHNRMMSAEEIRKAALDGEANAKSFQNAVAEDRSEQWDRHRDDLAYELKGPSEEQEVRMAEAQERAEGREETPEQQPEQFQVSYYNAAGDRTGQYYDHGSLEDVIAEAYRGRKGNERITVFDRDKCERAYDSDEALPAKLEQTHKKQQHRRQGQPQTPPPHVLYRPPGPSRGMER